eukprot:10530648-Alexandrium_andersonii.AAC.1
MPCLLAIAPRHLEESRPKDAQVADAPLFYGELAGFLASPVAELKRFTVELGIKGGVLVGPVWFPIAARASPRLKSGRRGRSRPHSGKCLLRRLVPSVDCRSPGWQWLGRRQRRPHHLGCPVGRWGRHVDPPG